MVILTCGWCCRIVNCVTAVWPARWIPWPDDEDAWAVQPQPHPLALCGILALSGVGGYDGWLFGDAVGGRDLVMDVALWKVCWLCWQHENGLCCCQFGWCHPSQQVFAFAPVTGRIADVYCSILPVCMVVACSSIVKHIVLQNPLLGRCHATYEWHHCCRHCHCNTHNFFDKDICRAHFWAEYIQKVCCLCCSQCVSNRRCNPGIL